MKISPVLRATKWKTVLWDVLYVHLLYAVLWIPLFAVLAFVEFFVFNGFYYTQFMDTPPNSPIDIPALYSFLFYIHVFGAFTWGFYNRLMLRENLAHLFVITALTWLVSFTNLLLPEPDIKAIITNLVIILVAGTSAFLIYRNRTKKHGKY